MDLVEVSAVRRMNQDDEEWRKIYIGDEVKILLHQHALKKFIGVVSDQIK